MTAILPIPADLDTAYARQCGYEYTGRESLPGDDHWSATADAWATFYGPHAVIEVDVNATNVRLNLTPDAARELAGRLTAAADEADAGHDCGDHPGECCGSAIPIPGMSGSAA